MRTVVFILMWVASLGVAWAQQEAPRVEAEKKTREMLTNPVERKKVIDKSPSAKAADEQARAVGGTEEDTSKIYEITAGIFSDMVRDSDGDAVKMQEMAAKAMKDPEAFMNGLSPEHRRRIQELARKIEARKAAAPRP